MNKCKIYLEEYVYSFMENLEKDISQSESLFSIHRVLPVRVVLFGNTVSEEEADTKFIHGAASVMELSQMGMDEKQLKEKFFQDFKILGYLNIYGNISKDRLLQEEVHIFYENNEAMKNYMLYRAQYKPDTLDENSEDTSQEKARNFSANSLRFLPHIFGSIAIRILLLLTIILLAQMAASINYYKGMKDFTDFMGQAVTVIMQDK